MTAELLDIEAAPDNLAGAETPPPAPAPQIEADAMADMILAIQRGFLVSLTRDLSNEQVSPVQFFLLGYLEKDPTLTMTEIARKMGHSTAAATGLVDRLEKLGYVQRSHSQDDRRKVLVQITKKGAKLVTEMRGNIAATLRKLLADLTADERATWSGIYRKVFAKGSDTK